MPRASRRFLVYLLLVVVLGLGLWARLANYRSVLGTGDLIPQGDGDSFYHLYRSLDAVEHFPRVAHFDPLMNWPKGAYCPWADGFDLGAATFAVVFGGRWQIERAQIAIALWPVFLGILTILATMALTQVVAPGARWRAAGLAAAATVAVMPAVVEQSRLGRIDHHVFEMLIMTLLAAWSLQRLPVRSGAGAGVYPARTIFEIQGGVLAAVAIYSFTGSPLYVALTILPLCFSAWRDGQVLGSGGPGLLGGGVASALLTISAVVDHHRYFAFQVSSFLQPLMLVMAAVVVIACAWFGRVRGRIGGYRLAVGGVVVLLAAIAIALVLRPITREMTAAVWDWLLRHDPWLAEVDEFTPLLQKTRDIWMIPYSIMGWIAFLVPPALLVLLVTFVRHSPRMAHLLFIASSLIVLALLQKRFARVALPVLATCVALLIVQVLNIARVRLQRILRWHGMAILPSLFVLGLTLADVPTRNVLLPWPATHPVPFVEAALHLRHTKFSDEVNRGVFVTWTWGHHVEAVSGRPVVTNGFGPYLDAPEFWQAEEILQGDREAFDAYLRNHRLGAVLAGAGTIGMEVLGPDGVACFRNGVLNDAYFKAIPLSPLLIAGSAIPGLNVQHLPHLMPRFASHGLVNGLSFPLPYLWEYERVPGAVVRGLGPAGARVIAELRFFENGHSHTYKAFTDASSRSTWELVLPLPSAFSQATLTTDNSWTVAVKNGRPIHFAVPERAVRTGAFIDLRATPLTP